MQELEKILEEIKEALEENTEDIADEDGCHHFVIDGFTATYLVNKIIRKHMNDGWISVEERLPEDGTYLCTLAGELCGIEEPFTGMCGIENGIWDEPDCVIAWHPLPEPYHAERSRE